MDPITGTIAAVGIIAQLAGGAGGLFAGSKASGVAQQESAVSQQITALEGQENMQRQLAMQISSRRQVTQAIRQAQLRASQGLAAATNQGAQFGSGAQGGQAQEVAEGAFNVAGTNQQYEIGTNLFNLQGQVTEKQGIMSQLQGQLASLQGQQSMYAGISSIGASLSRSAGPMGNILGNVFNFGSQDLTQPLPGSSPLGQGGIGSA